DSHLHLTFNTSHSYRTYSPIYVETKGKKTIIKSVWESQIKSGLKNGMIGAQVLSINGKKFNKAIMEFPTHCNNKNNDTVRTWISNKIIAGRHDEPRILKIKTKYGKLETLNIDNIKLKEGSTLLSYHRIGDIGIIRFNNSFGESKTKSKFTKALTQLKNTKGLILDLRNTVDGGAPDIVNSIAGHFTKNKLPFQFYRIPKIKKAFADSISPQKPYYYNPVVMLVNRWTGSVGEGFAVGMAGTGLAKIVGTEMERLGGATEIFELNFNKLGYQMPVAKIFQKDGRPRKSFKPQYAIIPKIGPMDESMEKAIKLLDNEN
ncbi:MAG TPA: S41 family peptidase, partial [Balneolaceae bacterium]|nr:S41 family peptidase [Balneolaceae bacterium]